MARLITEESVYEYLSNKFNEFDISIFGNEFAGKILDGLGDIPTAYDVEKVVAELEKAKKYVTIDGKNTGLEALHPIQAIDIVRKGGVE